MVIAKKLNLIYSIPIIFHFKNCQLQLLTIKVAVIEKNYYNYQKSFPESQISTVNL